ncbi:hypothetical protein EDEG_03009 [Edhazardia aedis USNM 41457]|uniref:ABC transporter E family member 2 n=1 Tax=Edhazardia aedis (strain USNM 41457) TaxID=1003232 RepID=J9DMN3_EDHAE|nr:hypothetical protein EDEG_03009 [Edhazardia aedis USNM 41457]|eukprot:EJW02587.1 hypothetical protein EDEG_03009 [Edhazardia aedis USNM 41457]
MGKKEASKVNRLAIVDAETCKPSHCNLECKKACPVNKIGKECIVVKKDSAISFISELLCIGCGACVRKCPFDAITIINIPSDIQKDVSHRFFANSFKLHRLPIPKIGSILGIVGTNGIGKSTALKILAGEIKPNLGFFDNPPDWVKILSNYKGSELHSFFSKIIGKEIRQAVKIQYIDKMPNILKKKYRKDDLTVSDVIQIIFPDFCPSSIYSFYEQKNQTNLENNVSKDDEKKFNITSEYNKLNIKTDKSENGNKNDTTNAKNNTIKLILDNKRPEYYIEKFQLYNVLLRNIENLSGGELQRFVCMLTCLEPADIFFFDEPSSYLDVKQRLLVASAIRTLSNDKNYIVLVEHDLAILDLMCDYGCVLYGKPGAYGVITSPFSIKQAINIFLDGFIPNENMRFRNESLKFNLSERPDENIQRNQYNYPEITKEYEKGGKKCFELKISPGTFSKSEIIVFLGENGMGKTTFVGIIAGLIETKQKFPTLSVSVKPQKIVPKYKGTVRDLFMVKIRSKFLDTFFINEVIKPLNIEYMYDMPVANLSGGELQRIALTMCLGKDADVYLIDEPSAFLDSDQRIAICKVIKRFVYNFNKTAFIVEHDLIVGTYLADKIIVFDGVPGLNSTASVPMSIENGMNAFLKQLNVTFRRDPENLRPRVNKPNSMKDREQKESGKYFFA